MPADVTIYTTSYCGFCHRAKALLNRKGAAFEEIDVIDRPDLRGWLQKTTHQSTVPQVFINGRSVGGYSELSALDYDGALDAALKEAPGKGGVELRR